MSDYCITSCTSGGACVLSGGTCYVRRIPDLCSGALVSGGSCVSGATAAGSAIYNIDRLYSVLPGYNPSNTGLSAYAFVASDLAKVWQPAIYQGSKVYLSGAVITSFTTIVTGGVVPVGSLIQPCQDEYNTSADEFYVVSWKEAAEAAGGGA